MSCKNLLTKNKCPEHNFIDKKQDKNSTCKIIPVAENTKKIYKMFNSVYLSGGITRDYVTMYFFFIILYFLVFL